MGITGDLRATLVVSIHNAFEHNPASCHQNSLESAVDSCPISILPSNETNHVLKGLVNRNDLSMDDLRPYTTRLERYFMVVEDGDGNYPPWSRLLFEVTSQIPGRFDYKNPQTLAAEILAGTAEFRPNEAEKNDREIYTELMRRSMAAVCLIRDSGLNVQVYKQDRITVDDEKMRVRVIGTDSTLSVSPFDPYRNRRIQPVMSPKAAKAVFSREVRF